MWNPNSFINRHIKIRLIEINSKINRYNNDLKITLNDSTNKNVLVVSIPYYGNLSEIVWRFLRKYNVKVVFRMNSKLDRFIVFGKDPYEIGEQNNVVYKISCNCGKCYVGHTKRPLRIRIDEHLINLRILILMKNFTMSLVSTEKSMKMIKRITFFFEMVSKFYIKKLTKKSLF